MRLFYECSSETEGEQVEVSRRRCDELLDRAAGFDLLVAVIGDQVVVSKRDEAGIVVANKAPSRSDAMILLPYLLTRRWLRPSEAAALAHRIDGTGATGTSVGATTCRKHFEKARAAVDIKTVGVGGKVVWRAFEAGDLLNGQRQHRFSPDVDADGAQRTFTWCVVFSCATDRVWAHTTGAPPEMPMLSDAYTAFGIQNEMVGAVFEMVVRDAVVVVPTRELVMVADLKSQESRLSIAQLSVEVNGAKSGAESPFVRERIAASDDQRLMRTPIARFSVPTAARGKGRCFAFDLHEVWHHIQPGRLERFRLRGDLGDERIFEIWVPVRVHDPPWVA